MAPSSRLMEGTVSMSLAKTRPCSGLSTTAGPVAPHCKGSSCNVLLSCEGVTQGDPLPVVLRGLALTPLLEQSVVQP